MALMNCPECGKQISDKAENCIHCGFPIHPSSIESNKPDAFNNDGMPDKQTKSRTLHKNKLIILFAVFGAIIIFVSVYLLNPNSKEKEQKRIADSTRNADSLVMVQAVQQRISDSIAASDNLEFLSKFKGKYALSDAKLLDNPIMKKRLNKMLGDQFAFMQAGWQTESPIKINDGILYADGFVAHNCCDPYFIIMADIGRNVLYAGIKDNGKKKLYSENGSQVPQRLQSWFEVSE